VKIKNREYSQAIGREEAAWFLRSRKLSAIEGSGF
jgi:hypothetical protein